jgi:excisionase family DNA binding protein
MKTDLLTTTQAAELTGYHRVHLCRLVASGKVEGEKIGRDWLLSKKSLLAYFRNIEKQGAKRGPKTGA